jgi:hypothetical protein
VAGADLRVEAAAGPASLTAETGPKVTPCVVWSCATVAATDRVGSTDVIIEIAPCGMPGGACMNSAQPYEPRFAVTILPCPASHVPSGGVIRIAIGKLAAA